MDILKIPFGLSVPTRFWSIPCVWFSAPSFVISFGTVLFSTISVDSVIHSMNTTVAAWISLVSFFIMIIDLSYSAHRANLTTIGEQAYVVCKSLYAVALKTLHPHYRQKSLTYAYRDCKTYHNGHISEGEWNVLLHAMSETPVNSNLDVTQFAKPYNPTLPLTYIFSFRDYFFATIKTSPENYIWQCEYGLGRRPPENTSQLKDWMDLATSQYQKNVLLSVCEPIATENVGVRTRKM